MLARDEMANMVWGVEKIVPLPSGEPKDGRQTAYETRAFSNRISRAVSVRRPAASGRGRRENPLQGHVERAGELDPADPVHVPNDNREVQLQRGAMFRVLEGELPNVDPEPVRPRTSLLRPGLDETPPRPYFVHEEEVSRAGVRVTQSFQRTRWRDGRAWVWLGVRKQTGRGEGSSGLAFDRIEDVAESRLAGC